MSILILNRGDLEEVLQTVKELRAQGLTARQIAAQLDRMGYQRPSPNVAWETYHALQLLAELRKRGKLPPRGNFKERFQQF